MADENKGLRAFDIADPTHPRETWNRDPPEPGDALNVVVAGEGLFSVDGWLGLTAYNIGERPQSPNDVDVGLYLIDSVWNHWEK